MPLIKSKSKKALAENIKTEMEAGKPRKQSLAIALEIQRRNKRPKKMAEGGIASEAKAESKQLANNIPEDNSSSNMQKKEKTSMLPGFAHGGEASDVHHKIAKDFDEMLAKHDHDAVMEYMAGRLSDHKKMADGGMVDIEENNKEQPNSYYERNEDAALKENYDEDFIHMEQPEDSNEHGDDLKDEDSHDMVDKIMKKMKYKKVI